MEIVEQQLAHLQLIIGAQKEAIAAGLVSAKNLFHSAKELVKLAGHKNVDAFFTPPGAPADPADPTSARRPLISLAVLALFCQAYVQK